jgi:hypothetical protein
LGRHGLGRRLLPISPAFKAGTQLALDDDEEHDQSDLGRRGQRQRALRRGSSPRAELASVGASSYSSWRRIQNSMESPSSVPLAPGRAVDRKHDLEAARVGRVHVVDDAVGARRRSVLAPRPGSQPGLSHTRPPAGHNATDVAFQERRQLLLRVRDVAVEAKAAPSDDTQRNVGTSSPCAALRPAAGRSARARSSRARRACGNAQVGV